MTTEHYCALCGTETPEVYFLDDVLVCEDCYNHELGEEYG